MTVRTATVTALWVTLLSSSATFAQEIAWEPKVLLGRGYDALTGKVHEDCTNFEITTRPTKGLHFVDWFLTEITSNADLLSMLAVNASTSLDLGFASGSAEASIVKGSEINNFNANYVASARAERGWDFTKEVSVKDEYQNISPSEFRERCGNNYVSGVLYGGSFYSTIKIETTSIDDKKDVTAKIDASFGPFSGSGEMDESTRQVLSTRRAEIKGNYGGSSAQPIPLTFDLLRERLSEFPAAVLRFRRYTNSICFVFIPRYRLYNSGCA